MFGYLVIWVVVVLSQLLQISKIPLLWASKTKPNKTKKKFCYFESEKRFKAFIEHDLVWALIAHHTFYDKRPLRDKRSGCMWVPLRGKRRLLYDCVWIVFASQLCVNPASTLDESPRGSKFTTRKSADKLYLSSLIYTLIAAFQLVASHESTSPSVALVISSLLL